MRRERDLLREQALESGKPAQVSPASFHSIVSYREQGLLSTTLFHHLPKYILDTANAHLGN